MRHRYIYISNIRLNMGDWRYRCPYCQNQLKKESRFCGKCGRKCILPIKRLPTKNLPLAMAIMVFGWGTALLLFVVLSLIPVIGWIFGLIIFFVVCFIVNRLLESLKE